MADASTRDKALAGRIRAGGSDTYDLAGYSGAQVADLIPAAFGAPIEAPDALRVTLVVGGGKKVRGAYGAGAEGLVRDVCGALERLGFGEDRGASACLECAGSFKYQHDTDKDLKFVHVFPRIDTSAAAAAAAAAAADAAGDAPAPPEQQCLAAAPEALQKLVARRVTSFAQKRALLKVLKDAAASVAATEAKLARLETPTDAEQALYDTAIALPEKMTWLAAQMEAHIDAGQLTKAEQETVLTQLAAKIGEADAAVTAAKAEGKDAKAAKLEAARASLVAKRAAAAAIKPVTTPVKFEKDLKKLKAQLAELEKIEACRGLQPLETVKKLREKPGIEASIKDIYDANQGWFEDPEVFEKRMRAASKPTAPAKPASAAAAVASGGFSAPKGGGAKLGGKNIAKTGTSNPWAALGNE